jgi:hypothetical protein
VATLLVALFTREQTQQALFEGQLQARCGARCRERR